MKPLNRHRVARGGLALLLLVALAALAAACYNVGTENSWIRVQNMGSQAATVEVQYVNENGTVITSETSWPLAPGEGWTFNQAASPNVPKGFLGSAVLISDQPMAVLMAKDSDRGGGWYQAAGETIALNAGSGKLYLPLVTNRDGMFQDWNARFTVLNSGETTACATLIYTSNVTDSEVHWDPYRPSDSGADRLPGCPNGGMPIPPGGSIFRSWFTMGVGPGFTGSVRIELHKNDRGVAPAQQLVAATADIWNTNTRHFASYRGLTSDEMGTDLVLPLIEREANGEWSTDFEIMNSDPSQPATITLDISGWDGSQNPPQFITKHSTFTVQASRMCFQNSDWFNCLAPGDTLPRNFFDGTARLKSNKPVGVIISRSSNRSEAYVNFRAIRADQAARKYYLPLVDKNALGVFNRTGWHSWVRIITADGGAANITVRYFGGGLPDGQTSYGLSIYRSATIIQPWDNALPASFIGSAVIESDRPIAVIVDVVAGSFPGDPDIMYNGVPAS